MSNKWTARIGHMLATAESYARNAETHKDCATCDAGVTDHRTEFLEAASNARAMAERLMDEYRVNEEEALARDEAASSPITHKITITRDGGSDLLGWYTNVFSVIANHTGVRYATAWDRSGGTGHWQIVATVVGYEGDVTYAEFLWTAAYLMFSTRIDPIWDVTLPENENIYRLRQAGIERKRIAIAAGWDGTKSSARNKVQRIYLAECAKRGEQATASGLSHDTQTYREAYAQSFTHTLRMRLQAARDAADSVSGGMVLHGREERVNEAFYAVFPDRRPSTAVVPVKECADCKKTKHESGQCRLHRPRAWTARMEADWQRRNNSRSARQGRASGTHAAEGVVIKGTAKAQRLDRSHAALEG